MLIRKRKGKPSTSEKESAVPLTRRSVWLWVFLVLFFSAWMFGLGILVGRGTAPVRFDIEKLQKELATLKEKSLRSELLRFKIDRNTIEEKPDLPFYEALKATTEESPLPPPPPEKKESLPKKVDPKPVKEEPPASPVEPKEEQRQAEPKEDRISIQVASLQDRKDADKLVTILRVKGFPAYRTLVEVPGKGVWFRIRVGPYEKREEAFQAMFRLKKEKYAGFVVKD
ncbi:MAG: SPOR domain-containing protein [Desulfobacteraceae bacterium]|nr:MAG: SPOR domain-containing protein [Desulfobacteraceae bacterium]